MFMYVDEETDNIRGTTDKNKIHRVAWIRILIVRFEIST